jgi:hypothetical protein
MSWDLCIQRFPSEITCIDEIPDDFIPMPIGKREEIIQYIKKIIPEVDFSDPSWGTYKCADFYIEFSIGDEEICECITLHISGNQNVIPIIFKILEEFKLCALDGQNGGFFTPETASLSIKEWNEYRNQVVRPFKKRWWEFWK